MAATLQQHRATNGSSTNTATTPNPQLKRLVYSKYRELLGSYNDQANAYIDTLPSYMVQKDTGFNLDLKNSDLIINSAQQNGNAATHHQPNEMYGAGQRMPAQQTYEAPACVQNAMMTKDKKPFTYTPGGIDLSQIKSERMAKRLARNAQAEGATGIQQQNRPTQPQSLGGSSPNAAAAMGAAAMGMPFQVLPPPPPPSPGKSFNGGSAPAPPPPPSSSSNFSNVGTLAPPAHGNGVGGRGSAPNSPNMPRKSPTPQRFEPPPMGFRPEIKIPPNPMAALRKVPTPVEKNTFWKDEYVKDRSKSPLVDSPHHAGGANNNDNVHSNSSSPQTMNANNNGTAIPNNDNIDGFKKTMPTTTTNNSIQPHQTSNNYTNYQQPQQQEQQLYTPPQQTQQSPIRPLQQSPQYGGSHQPPTAQLQQIHISQQAAQPPPQQQQQQQQSYRPEFRSVAAPTSPAVNVYTRQTDSPRSAENSTPSRATESPFKFSQQQQRAPPAVSPLAQQQSTPSTASSGASVSPNNTTQTVPWRTQRGQSQQPQQYVQPSAVAQPHPQPIYNSVQQQPQRSPDFSTQQSAYQGPKPTNVGSLYIAPLAPPTEPQAQHIVRQQMQQQQQQQQQLQQHRDSPHQQQQPNQQLRWMNSQPLNKEQPAWARPEENGNVVPSSLNRIKSPPPNTSSSPSQATHQLYQPASQGNGFMPHTAPHNFGAQPINATGLRLQINTPINQANAQNAPKERIIPIQLEQTPTYSPVQPTFNNGAGSNSPAPGYVMRTPNQFVDQGYNNFGQPQQQQQQQPPTQRVMSPTLQQLNAPRMVQQTQNNAAAAVSKTHIIPIAIENNEGTRGPISKTPIVIQNDQRTPPVQSKSFRILQKITDTIDEGTNGDNAKQQQQHVLQEPVEPQLQRPTFARQMSAQQAHHSPTVEQMRRMQIGHEQGNYYSAPTTPSAFQYNQQRTFYDNNSQKYVPPSEQQVAEPKKYTGSAIPSRSFKILQAMTQPENADKSIQEKQENCAENNEINEIESKPESNNYNSCASNSSSAEPALSSSSTTINSELGFSSSSSPTPPPTQPIPYSPYPYPYGYPWYLPPPPHHHVLASLNSEHSSPHNWHYPYGMAGATPTPAPINGNREHSVHYPPYPYYYPYYPPPLSTHAQIPVHASPPTTSSEYDMQNMYPSYMPPPPHPYLAYPYPVAASYSQGSNSSRASSVLPDIIITPSTDDVPSKVIMQHHIKVERQPASKRAGSIEIDDVTALKSSSPAVDGGSVVEALTQHLENMQNCLKNNLNIKCQAKNSFKKNIEHKSPEDNTSPVQSAMVMTESEREIDQASTDSEVTPKQVERKESMPLKSIKSVNNVQIYKAKQLQQPDSEETEDTDTDTDSVSDDEDDKTTADGESDIFDEEDEDEISDHQHDFDIDQDSETEEFMVDDSLSVIYEEESEIEKSCSMNKTAGQNESKNNESIRTAAEEEEELEDSTSVTVRLPLKFSFSSSTVEVGKSQIEEQRSNNSMNEKRNNFNVASIQDSDTEDDELDDCDVSVTISLSQSSRSNSLDNQQIYTNMDHLYPIEDMPLSVEVFEKLEESRQEDVAVSFSLNMRNKFANETTRDGVTNNIAIIEEDKEKVHNKDIENEVEVAEELDFFATLMATKMQAQKIKEQSASYWGKSQEKAAEATKDAEKPQEKTQNKENKANGRKTTIKKTKSKAKLFIKTYDLKENNEIKSKKTCETLDTSFKALDKCQKPKFSFWDRCSHGGEENKLQNQELNKHTEDKETEHQTNIMESKKFTSQHQGDIKYSSANSVNTHLSSEKTESSADVQEAEEIADIWADREEDLPPIKPIKSKLKTLEAASQSFWSSVYESEKELEKLDEQVPHKSLMEAEMIDLNVHSLSYSVQALSPPQKACEGFIAEEKLEDSEESEEVDFWAEINQAKLNKPSESRQEASAFNQPTNFKKQDLTSTDFTLTSSFREQEYCIYNEEHMPTTCEFDPFKYPEEPREVDTDEEIDFWAEIEANKQAEDDDVTFHKSASFWASQERQNSVDEAPYKPVLPKAFHAKLPDEPPTQNISIWAALEAHKGEEPVIIDPVQEEENLLAQQYDIMINAQELTEEQEFNDETISVHEPIKASLWCDPNQNKLQELDTEIQYKEEALQDITEEAANKTEKYELEVKRSNYRKAMAFFTTSIDENKDLTSERGKSKYSRNSWHIEEENEKWDWDSVNEALEQEKGKSSENLKQEATATEQTVVKDYSNRFCESVSAENNEPNPNINLQTTNTTNNVQAVATTTPVIRNATSSPEAEEMQEVCKEPISQCLPHRLPDLEVKKFNENRKISVKDRISAFETGTIEKSTKEMFRNSMQKQCLSVECGTRQSSLSRNSSTQRSESEMDEDDSGVTDMNKQLSETDTESESFPELRKMSSYQRAATHSRLFKLLQDDPDVQESHDNTDEYQFKPSRKKIVHNVSITRKQNPTALAGAETMSQRRERLSLPLCKNTSIDNDNPSTPNSPASPIIGHTANKSPIVSEKLVSELVQSLLLKSDSTHFRKLPMEKLQAAAKRVLEEELDSLENTSIDSTPGDIKKDKSYNDYYNTWSDALGTEDIVPSKSFRALQDSRRSSWTARCPRVLSSKTINRDLARVTESPEISVNSRQSRDSSVGKWKKS